MDFSARYLLLHDFLLKILTRQLGPNGVLNESQVKIQQFEMRILIGSRRVTRRGSYFWIFCQREFSIPVCKKISLVTHKLNSINTNTNLNSAFE